MPPKKPITINLRPLSHIAFALAVMDDLYGPGWQPEEVVQDRLRSAQEAVKVAKSKNDPATNPNPLNESNDQPPKSSNAEER